MSEPTAEKPVFMIRVGRRGESVRCAYCAVGVDLDHRGVLPVDGPLAINEKGRPTCRDCLQKLDPEFLAPYLLARASADRAEAEAYLALHGRRSSDKEKTSKARGVAMGVHQEFAADLAADIERAILVDPKHLKSKRRVVAASSALLQAIEQELEAAHRMLLGGMGALAIEREQAEVQYQLLLKKRTEIEAALAEARIDLLGVDAKLRRDLAAGVEISAETFAEARGEEPPGPPPEPLMNLVRVSSGPSYAPTKWKKPASGGAFP